MYETLPNKETEKKRAGRKAPVLVVESREAAKRSTQWWLCGMHGRKSSIRRGAAAAAHIAARSVEAVKEE